MSTARLKRNVPLYQQVYEEIRKAILTGKIKPGTKINETLLAEQYQISRTPLREAMRQLQNEGLLMTDRLTTTVVKLDQKDFEELCECRLILEKYVVESVTKHITDQETARLSDLLSETKTYLEKDKEIDYMHLLNLNSKFHELMYQTCENKRLLQLLTQTRSLLLLYRASVLMNLSNKEENSKIIKEHEEILNAVKARDVKRAMSATEVHIKGDISRGKAMK